MIGGTPDYGAKALKFYNKVKVKGGPITLIVPETAAEDIIASSPEFEGNPDMPWNGNTKEPAEFPHIALMFPVMQDSSLSPPNVNSIYIPGHLLPVPVITSDMHIRDAGGMEWGLKNPNRFNVDGKTTIYWLCQLEEWRA